MVSGQAVKADVGGNLIIESLQDSSRYNASSSGGAGFSVTVGPSGVTGASISSGSSRTQSNFDSVAAAGSATVNNYLNHAQAEAFGQALKNCDGNLACIKQETQNSIQLDSEQSADANTCQSGRLCAEISNDARTGLGIFSSNKKNIGLCNGEPTCLGFLNGPDGRGIDGVGRQTSNDSFNANDRASSVPVMIAIECLIDQGFAPDLAQMLGGVTPLDIVGAGTGIKGVARGVGGKRKPLIVETNHKAVDSLALYISCGWYKIHTR